MRSRCPSVVVPPLPPPTPTSTPLAPLSSATMLHIRMYTVLVHGLCPGRPATARLALDCKRALPSQNILRTQVFDGGVQLDTFTRWPALASPLVTCGRRHAHARILISEKSVLGKACRQWHGISHIHTLSHVVHIFACLIIIKCCPQVSFHSVGDGSVATRRSELDRQRARPVPAHSLTD
jgi:hypothetical protein